MQDLRASRLLPQLGDKSLFAELSARAYLAHASISPVSARVRAAVQALLDDYAHEGALAHSSWAARRRRLRDQLAVLIGAHPEDIALVSSTTRGISDIALCIPWSTGDRVLLFSGEFPANVTPWQRAADLYSLEVRFLDAHDYLEDPARALVELEAELGRGARLVAVSAVEFQTGLRMPLARMAELCHAHGAELAVDAVQACGAVPLDVAREQIDYLSCGAHKFLMGLEGAGFVFVSPRAVTRLRPHVAGWLSHEEPDSFLYAGPGHLRYDRPIRQSADFLEAGTLSAVGFAALGASVETLLELGVPAIFAHVNRYLDELEPLVVARGFRSLRARDAERRSCILSLVPPAGVNLGELRNALGKRGVVCAIPDGLLRFAPHWPNHLGEIPLVARALDEALDEAQLDLHGNRPPSGRR
jgi:selenocysteine lyase/cysteine desulfurase